MSDIFNKTSAHAAIDACLERVADYVAAGNSPNDAIAEAVKLADLHPSAVQILAQAYNTAAINQQRLLGSDINEKTAAVPLADTDVIMESLYPTPHKPTHIGQLGSPATLRKIASESPRAVDREQISAGLALLRSSSTKTAAATPPAEPPYFAQRNAALAKEAAANRELFNAGITLAAAVEKLGHYLQQLEAPAVVELAPRVEIVCGEQGVKSLYEIADGIAGLKLASKCRDFAPGVEMVQAVSDGITRYQRAQEAVKVARDAVPPSHVPAKTTEHTQKFQANDNDAIMRSLRVADTGTKLAEEEKQGAGPFATAAVVESMRQLSKQLQSGLKSDPIERNLSALSDPMHERRLQQIRSQATLVDLMNNDDVIAGHDPDEVISAWNQLLELSPQIGDKRILAQNALRTRMAQGGLDPFATSQLVDVGQKLTPKPQTVAPPRPEPQFGRN